MGFVVPAFLAGLAFAAIPVVLHFLHRRRLPQIRFAATRFLESAAKRTARKRRIDNLLLLALRVLVLALLAAGLAGPVIKRAAGMGRAGSDVVIVVDNSLSMAAAGDSAPRFTKAKEGVEAMLSRLADGDLAAVVAVAPPESREETGFTGDTAEVRKQLARLAASHARGSMAAAFERAAALLGESSASSKILYIVTDLQANAFPSKETLSNETRAALVDVPVIVYDCGADSGRNISVSAVAVRSQGAVKGAPVEVRATVKSASPAEETVAVSLTVAGERVQRRTVTIAPGGAAETTLTAVAREAGVLEGLVEAETTDALSADNRRYFSLVVRERIRALVLERERRTPAFEDDAFFLERALDPFRGEGQARSPFDVTVSTYDAAGDFGAYDIVYAIIRGALPAETAERLRAFAAGGGSVVAFPCDDAAAEGLEWLPARLVSVKSADRARGESFAVASLDGESEALQAFRDEPATLYSAAQVYSYWLLDPAESSGRVLARFDGGDPAIVEARDGAGSVVFATAPVRGTGTLPASQFFLPLVYELSYHLLAVARGGGEVCAGETVQLPMKGAGTGLVVTTPDGASRLARANEAGEVVFTDTLTPGVYRASEEGRAEASTTWSVNVDAAESDLARLREEALSERCPGAKALRADTPEGLSAALAALEPVLALGDILLYAVLAIALVECLTANRTPRTAAGRG